MAEKSDPTRKSAGKRRIPSGGPETRPSEYMPTSNDDDPWQDEPVITFRHDPETGKYVRDTSAPQSRRGRRPAEATEGGRSTRGRGKGSGQKASLRHHTSVDGIGSHAVAVSNESRQEAAGGLAGADSRSPFLNTPISRPPPMADEDEEVIDYAAQQDRGHQGRSNQREPLESAVPGSESRDWRKREDGGGRGGRGGRGSEHRGGNQHQRRGGQEGGSEGADRDVRRVKSHSAFNGDRANDGMTQPGDRGAASSRGNGIRNGGQSKMSLENGGRNDLVESEGRQPRRLTDDQRGSRQGSARNGAGNRRSPGEDAPSNNDSPAADAPTTTEDGPRNNHPSNGRGMHRKAASQSSIPSQIEMNRRDPGQSNQSRRAERRLDQDRSSTLEVTFDPVSNQPVMHRKDRRRRGRSSIGVAGGEALRAEMAEPSRFTSPGFERDNGGGRGERPRTPRRSDPVFPAERDAVSAGRRPPPGPPNRVGQFASTPTNGRGGGRLWVDPDKNKPQSPATPKRPNVYEEYLPMKEVSDLLKRGTLLQGSLRINRRNRYDAYVSVDGSETDIFICGLKNRNRAFEGDTVAVKLLEGDALQNEVNIQKERKVKRKKENAERQKKCDMDEGSEEEEEVEEEGEAAGGDDDDPEGPVEDRIFGKVVYILERRPDQSYAGTLQFDSPANKSSPRPDARQSAKIIWFKPTDKRVPLMAIPIEHAPKDFLAHPEAFEDILFRAHVRKWQATSQHPFGVITGTIGQMGEIPIETEALLCDAGIDWDDFPEEVLECLPETPWIIPDEEIAKRRDLRDEQIFSIDPPTAKDLDDAVSCKPLGDGTFEVGVHIADVSYFVPPNTALDKEAMYRATTVYLVQKAIPMLPPLLCEQLCSLNPGVDRLAFSVIWKVDAQARPIGTPWFGRTIIRSCAKLSYDHAQALIEGRGWDDLPAVQLSGGVTVDDIKKTTMQLYEFSVQMRKRRFENGALAIHSIKLWFAVDGDGNPVDSGVYQIRDSNKLIEEFMLLANMAVAKKISTHYPEFSLLRRHAPPSKRPMQEFIELAASLGYTIDATDSSSLQASFEAIPTAEKRQVLKLLCIKPMQRAKYFCTGAVDVEQWHHYALNVPLYTHFTSPIRRYCDLVVHRLLDCCLRQEADQATGYDKSAVTSVAKQCNARKEASKAAQDASQKLFLCAYLSLKVEREGKPILEEALVYNIGSRSLDVLVGRYGIEKRLWVEDLVETGSVVGSDWDEEGMKIHLYWRKKEGGAGGDGDVVDALAEQVEELMVHEKRLKEGGGAVAEVESGIKELKIADGEEGEGDVVVKKFKMRKRREYDPARTRIQTIGMFRRIMVHIVPDVSKSPPDFRVYVAYPGDDDGEEEEALRERVERGRGGGYEAAVEGREGDVVVSCPGIVDEAE
ncbi:hypothetical protein HDV00_006560 [Rhizophlyctis rosea]|nr:hypothetical protein HDV00_006560 [Rhizophlyctis rosea]